MDATKVELVELDRLTTEGCQTRAGLCEQGVHDYVQLKSGGDRSGTQ